MMETSTNDIEELAELCLQSAKKLKEFLVKSGSDKLGFDAKAPPLFPKGDDTIQRTREDLRNAAKTLNDLVTGPQECLVEASLTSVSPANKKNIWEMLEKEAHSFSASMDRFHEIHLPFQGPRLCS